MSNEWLAAISIFVDLSLVLVLFRAFRKEGLYLIIVANTEVNTDEDRAAFVAALKGAI